MTYFNVCLLYFSFVNTEIPVMIGQATQSVYVQRESVSQSVSVEI